jgi:hypothetical protein
VIDLKPLIVVTGTIHVEGGERNRVQSESTRNGNRQRLVVDRSVSPPRRAANVIVVDYGRRLSQMTLLRTPFGILVEPKRLEDLKSLLATITRKIAEFNLARGPTTRLANHVLCERLAGVRLTAVAGWLEAKRKDKDETVLATIDELVRPVEATA